MHGIAFRRKMAKALDRIVSKLAPEIYPGARKIHCTKCSITDHQAGGTIKLAPVSQGNYTLLCKECRI